MKSAGFFLFLTGIVISLISTIPYLVVMVANTDPMMSKPTPQIVLLYAGGFLGLFCLLGGIALDRIHRQRHAQRIGR